ncbi:MAG TPA: GNAT family N-acetyltransferase [Candidatus Acidoferrales bacterium]|nr:GNAT family N-acetyltransferase [Candidatus Acidoferrales bacterium]
MPPAPNYFLSTPRLGFRHWSAADLPLALSLWGDAQVTRLIGGPFSPQDVEQRLRREIALQDSRTVQYWPIFLLAGGDHVGCAGLRPFQQSDHVFELGFHLLPAFWSKGLAQEAARAVITYAFSTLHASALFAGHHPENAASRRVLEKLGFHYTHDELYPPTGRMHRCYLLPAPANDSAHVT